MLCRKWILYLELFNILIWQRMTLWCSTRVLSDETVLIYDFHWITILGTCLWRLQGVILASDPSGSFLCGLLFILKQNIKLVIEIIGNTLKALCTTLADACRVKLLKKTMKRKMFLISSSVQKQKKKKLFVKVGQKLYHPLHDVPVFSFVYPVGT